MRRAGCADRVVWAFASILDAPALGDVVSGLGDGLADLSSDAVEGLSARLVRDELLDATVVHIEAGPAAPKRLLDEVLRRMVAVVGTAELLDALA